MKNIVYTQYPSGRILAIFELEKKLEYASDIGFIGTGNSIKEAVGDLLLKSQKVTITYSHEEDFDMDLKL